MDQIFSISSCLLICSIILNIGLPWHQWGEEGMHLLQFGLCSCHSSDWPYHWAKNAWVEWNDSPGPFAGGNLVTLSTYYLSSLMLLTSVVITFLLPHSNTGILTVIWHGIPCYCLHVNCPQDLMPYLDKGPKEHHAAQPQKRPRKVDQETSIGKQGMACVQRYVN